MGSDIEIALFAGLIAGLLSAVVLCFVVVIIFSIQLFKIKRDRKKYGDLYWLRNMYEKEGRLDQWYREYGDDYQSREFKDWKKSKW